jgi:serine/threonine-protein kinase
VLQKGARVAGYEIEGVLGRGGMGIVYEARQLALGRKVALKVLTVAPGMDPSFRERFRKEGRVQAAIDHPNIVTVYEAGEWEEAPFIAMQLVRGDTLKEKILAQELESGRTLRLLRPIAGALDAAHAAGVIHRDVKPQNILVGAGDRPYLADFGLTKGLDDTALTRAGQFVGTLDYVAPEQIRGQRPTPSCDVYALGAVLFECLTGAVPYRKHADAAVLYAHLSEPPPLVTDVRADLPSALDEVIQTAMEKDPGARQASATELIDQAEAALEPHAPVEVRSVPEPAAVSAPPQLPRQDSVPTVVPPARAKRPYAAG